MTRSTNHVTSRVAESELYTLNRFYKRHGHKGKADMRDTAFWLKDEDNVLAALRFTSKDGHILLRGLWVHKERRREGLGSSLLVDCSHYWKKQTCFCYPFSHLEKFYVKHGFTRAENRAPKPLLEKLKSYQQRGEKVILMQYQPPCD